MRCWQRPLRRRETRTREGSKRAVVRPVEKAFANKLFEEFKASRAVQLPETTRLRESQAETWHLVVLTANPRQESSVG